DTTKANFLRSLAISCYSFTEVARLALPLMTNGGSLITLTYEGATRVMPSYNVMGVAKAALEASVRYRRRSWPAGGAGERDLARPDAHAGGRGDRRCALRLSRLARCLAAPPQCRADRCRRCRALLPVGPQCRRDRHGPLRRLGLSCHRPAARRQRRAERERREVTSGDHDIHRGGERAGFETVGRLQPHLDPLAAVRVVHDAA